MSNMAESRRQDNKSPRKCQLKDPAGHKTTAQR